MTMPLSDEELVALATSYEVSHALATAAIQFLTRIGDTYGDIPAIRDFRNEFQELHTKYVVPRRDPLIDTTAVQTIPNLRIIK
jgi:uncharacterized protein with HEPN domain